MTRSQKTILAVLGSIVAILLCYLGWIGYQIYRDYWETPLGPSLSLPTLPASLSTGQPVSSTPALTSTSNAYVYLPTITPPPTFTPIATFTPSAMLCGGPTMITLLAIGVDARSNQYEYGLADAIRIVRVDFSQPRVSILEVPRDLWVEIPEIADNMKDGQNHEKLNQAYLYGNPGYGYWNDPSAGPGLLARTLNLNFGIAPDHYVAVNMRTFEKIVDAVGGIDVTLTEAVDARKPGDMRRSLYYPKGVNHLDGQHALQLARLRNEGVFQRADTQNLVLCALRAKLLTPKVLPKIPDIIKSFQNNIQTDLSPEQIGQLSCLGTRLSADMIVFASFPESLFKPTRIFDPVFNSRLFIWDVDFNILRTYVNEFNRGTWPTASTSSEPGPDTAYCP